MLLKSVKIKHYTACKATAQKISFDNLYPIVFDKPGARLQLVLYISCMKLIRQATEQDAPAMLAIYQPFILNTSITFESLVPTAEAFAGRIKTYLENWPWLVCEIDGQIAGYAYGSRYRERTGYQWCVESSVYVQETFQRSRAGKALYTALLDILKMQGYRNIYAVINLPNEKSVAFHESMGYKWIASYENVGYKLGQWKTVGWWQLIINAYVHKPAAPVPFSEISFDALAPILDSASLLIR
jgi:phosphinothricin acetyltransferase